MVMLAGTVAVALLLDRFTSTPPSPAGTTSVTVPVELCPPVTDAGLRVTSETVPVPTATGLMTSVAETEFAEFAVIVAKTDKVTEEVETVNDPLD